MEIMAREVDKITATVVIEIDVRTGWPKTQMTKGGGRTGETFNMFRLEVKY